MKTTADVLELSRRILCQECASARAYATEKLNSFPFWKDYLRKTNGIFLLELLEDAIGEENCEILLKEIQKNRTRLLKVLEELNYEKNDDCGYDKGLIQLKLIEKLIASIDQSAKEFYEPDEHENEHTEDKNCPMCVMNDFLDCAKTTSEHNQNNWINGFEHLWSNQSPRFEKCCIRCLLYLNNRYSASCQIDTEKENLIKMINAISEGINEFQLESFHRVLSRMRCKDCNHLVDKEKTWQNLMIREYFFCMLQTITIGLSKTTFTCHLRKSRIHNLAYHFLTEVCDVWLMNNRSWFICWDFFKKTSMFENLNIQLKKLKSELDKEERGLKCECTDIWERNQNMMKKIGHKRCEEKRKYQDLEYSMEKMAIFSLEEDLDGCPMKYNHGIELDDEIVKRLKETTDSEAGTNENKCLCAVIDSMEPNIAISRANFEHAVSFFINWWKYEASYPHLLCHVCVDRLELIQNGLRTLPGFYNCELRKMRILKTFERLTKFIQEFLISKGRVFPETLGRNVEEDFEKMPKVFDSFISQWNLFRFGSESDQQFLVPGTVCHCTETFDINRFLKNVKISRMVEQEYKSLMAGKLAKFKLTKIIAGCPLDFHHNVNDDCFESFESDQSCSSSDDSD